MLKRLCDLCEAEIPEGDKYYDVIMRVMQDPDYDEDELDQEYSNFCYACTTSGQALIELMRWYEERTASEAAPSVVLADDRPTDIADARSSTSANPRGGDRE